MKLDLRPLAAALLAIALALTAAVPVRAQSFSNDQRGERARPQSFLAPSTVS